MMTMKHKFKKISSFKKTANINNIISLLMLFFGILMIIPIIWTISTSFKPLLQVWQPNWIPNPPSLINYGKVFSRIPVFRFLYNSFVVSFIATFAQLLITTLAAYAFARIRFKGRNVMFLIFLGTMMIPAYILIIPQYLIIDYIGLINTYTALFLPRIVSVFAIYMLRAFFTSIPQDLDESAYLDGAGRFTVLFKIIVPLSRPAYSALFIFIFMTVWNDFMWPLIVTSQEKMRTIQVGIAYFRDANTTDYGATMAASFIAAAPVLVTFLIANRQFVKGITLTGIKG
jgi:multiple sugar transport system permease protein